MNQAINPQLNFYIGELDKLRNDLKDAGESIGIDTKELDALRERLERHEKDFYTWVNLLTNLIGAKNGN